MGGKEQEPTTSYNIYNSTIERELEVEAMLELATALDTHLSDLAVRRHDAVEADRDLADGVLLLATLDPEAFGAAIHHVGVGRIGAERRVVKRSLDQRAG